MPENRTVAQSSGYINVDALESTDTPVDKKFVDSVRAYGVLTPITLAACAEPPHRVVDGLRRLAAARLSGITEVPYVAYELAEATQEAATLLLNDQRSNNVVAEILAIKAILARNLTEKQIAEAICKPISVIRRKAKLLKLIPGLFTALTAYRLRPSIAYQICTWPAARQEKALQVLMDTGHLTSGQVRELAQAARSLDEEKLDLGDIPVDEDETEIEAALDASKPAIQMLNALAIAAHRKASESGAWQEVQDQLYNALKAIRANTTDEGLQQLCDAACRSYEDMLDNN